jgi:hypothetical protein
MRLNPFRLIQRKDPTGGAPPHRLSGQATAHRLNADVELPGHASQADATGFRHLWKLTTCELKRAQTHSTLLIRNANERVAQFLLEMVSRESNATKIDLPMSRQDIADYLGLTVETVSRVLGGFEAADVIARPTARHVVVRDRAKLKRFDRVSNPPRPPVR